MSKINKRIEALEAELQKLKNEVKNDIKLEAGKWYWFGFEDECNKRYLILFDRVVEKGYFYKYMINILSEHYLNKRNDYISKSNTFLGEATYQEVEEALIEEAKKRGFKDGVSFKTVERKGISGSYNTKFKFDRMNVCIYKNETVLLNNCDGCIFCNGVWAEIVKGEPIKIGGYEVVKDGSDYKIGCRTVQKSNVQYFKDFMISKNFKKISFDGVETDVETLIKILSI